MWQVNGYFSDFDLVRILVDAYNIVLPKGTGVATYGRNFIAAARGLGHSVDLIYGLPIRAAMSPVLQTALLRSLDNPSRGKLLNRVERYGGALRTLGALAAFGLPPASSDETSLAHLPEVDGRWNSFRLYPRAIGAFRTMRTVARLDGIDADVAHWTYPLPIRLKRALNIYTIHDLVPLTRAELSLDNRATYCALMERLCRSADHIITISETSKADIIRLFGVDDSRITNTYQAHDITKETIEQLDENLEFVVESVCGLPLSGYFIFFGAVEPKKNLGRIVEAYALSGVDSPLVIVTAPGWRGEAELALIAAFGASPILSRIRLIDYLPRDVLLALIRGARATIFPSLAEGFGLPVLESLALGTPAITSNEGALREVAGDAAILVDPLDVVAIRDAIRRLEGDDDLVRTLAEKGLKRAERFSREVYQSALRDLLARL